VLVRMAAKRSVKVRSDSAFDHPIISVVKQHGALWACQTVLVRFQPERAGRGSRHKSIGDSP
jgi:hypothetical protein